MCATRYICVCISSSYGCNHTSFAARQHINLSNTNSERKIGVNRGSVCLCVCVCAHQEEEERGEWKNYSAFWIQKSQEKEVWLSCGVRGMINLSSQRETEREKEGGWGCETALLSSLAVIGLSAHRRDDQNGSSTADLSHPHIHTHSVCAGEWRLGCDTLSLTEDWERKAMEDKQRQTGWWTDMWRHHRGVVSGISWSESPIASSPKRLFSVF